jgi:site-specific DNA-methyltransferase (adenine-specific)
VTEPDPVPSQRQDRARGTVTSSFGVGRRESHDASPFYARFAPPELSGDDVVAGPVAIDDPFVLGDARHMDVLPDASVALVVTSPPYFAGKQYEAELSAEGVPGSYAEYLELLCDVFRECKRVLEPGGRIAVNVANLGRRPYRSLSADVTRILQDDLHLLPRGEVIWRKSEGASGNCAWGSFRSPANPVLRDVTERVILASKGRFDRAVPPRERRRRGLPWEATTTTDEFMAATLDVWEIAPESARRVHHPAPFPVELPERLIHLYTYRDDLVLDPFMGSGSALVAAVRAGRRYVGDDTDPDYVALARGRVAAEVAPSRRAGPEGAAVARAMALLREAGFTVDEGKRVRGTGVTPTAIATGPAGTATCVEVSGGWTVPAGGLARTAVAWQAVGRAHVLAQATGRAVLLLTTHLPRPGSEAERALRGAGAATVLDVLGLADPATPDKLAALAQAGAAGVHSHAVRPGERPTTRRTKTVRAGGQGALPWTDR